MISQIDTFVLAKSMFLTLYDIFIFFCFLKIITVKQYRTKCKATVLCCILQMIFICPCHAIRNIVR